MNKYFNIFITSVLLRVLQDRIKFKSHTDLDYDD